MKITGQRLIFLGGATIATAGVVTMVVNSLIYANQEEYKKDRDYKIWSRLIRKASTQDVCVDKLGGIWRDETCNEPSEKPKKNRIILPNKIMKNTEKNKCSEMKDYLLKSDTDYCVKHGIILLNKSEFDFENNFRERKIDNEDVIFNGPKKIQDLLKTGGVGKSNDAYEVGALVHTGGEKYVVVFKPETFEGEKEYSFPKPLKGVAIDHLCSRLDNDSIFLEKVGGKTQKPAIKRIEREKVFLLNKSNNQIWSCGWEKHVKLI